VSNTLSFLGGKFIPLSRPRHKTRFKFWPACLQRFAAWRSGGI